MTPTRETFDRDVKGSDSHEDTTPDALTPETIPETEEPSNKIVDDGSLKPAPADDSDTDFQSAYSTSPRNSFAHRDPDSESDDLDDLPPVSFLNKRGGVENSATVPRPMITASS